MQYFQRLFALDRQVEFLDARSTKLLGNKMQIMYFRAHERRSEALGSLTASGLEIIYLRQQFKEQVRKVTVSAIQCSPHWPGQGADTPSSLIRWSKSIKGGTFNP